MDWEPSRLVLQWPNGFCSVKLYGMNVLAAEDNPEGGREWTAQITEAELVRAVMERYPAFRAFVQSGRQIDDEYIRVQEDYLRRSDELTKQMQKRLNELDQQARDLKALRTIMGEPPEDSK